MKQTLKTLLTEKLEHDENLILKVIGEVGDLSRMILEIEKRVKKLEQYRQR